MISSTPIDPKPIIDYMHAVPFDVRPQALYTPFTLYEGFNPDKPESFHDCFDTRVYRHFIYNGKHARTIEESFSRVMHDYAIHLHLNRFFESHDKLLCVGIMGGHALKRTDPMFRQIAFLAKRLTRMGFYMITGGGPGAMEATHLGAWMAQFLDEELDDAINILSVAPDFTDPLWLATAFQVITKYPQNKYESLGIPTWLYGHEPSTPFASPMIFLGKQFWTEEIPVYKFLTKLTKKGKYKNLILSATDQPEDVVVELIKFQHQANVYPDKFKFQ